MRDRHILYTASFLRALATGAVSVLLGIYLSRLGFDAAAIGTVVGSGLAGAAGGAILVTFAGDRIGRRRVLIATSLLGAAGGAVVATASGLPLIAGAAFVGMLNGMGRERGAGMIIDQAVLPATAPDAGRTMVFAKYNVLQDAGHALGSLLAGVPALLRAGFGMSDMVALRAMMLVYAGILLLTAGIYLGLSGAVESRRPASGGSRISPRTRRTLVRISSLFAVDSLAGGFLTTALLAYFFYERFGAAASAVAVLFFVARVANAASHIGAARLAGRIGLVNTMVFTHIPSSLLLVAVPFAPNFLVAAAIFLLRECLVEMDVPTRQSYVMAVVDPGDRTFAAGVTHVVRLGSWAVAPAFAGLLMRGLSLASPLFIGAGMKVTYDLLLYAAFRRTRPPEERARER